MGRTSVLGPMERRHKTDLRLPYPVVQAAKKLAESIGVPLNAIFAIAAAQYVVSMAGLDTNRTKREQIIAEMEELFQNIVRESRKAA